MKKVLTLILVFIMVTMCFCGCGKSSNESEETKPEEVKAQVINNDGVTEYLTISELLEIKNQNQIKFDDAYWSAFVTVTGQITEIESSCIVNGLSYDWIVHVGRWTVGDNSFNQSLVSEDFISTLNVGDTVEISGEIVSVDGFGANISNGTINIVKK